MTDFIMIWDSPILFEKLFQEHDMTCDRVNSSSINTPFLPACKGIIIPTGFANPAYSKVYSNIEKCADRLEKFVKNGGTLVVYGPTINEYDYCWLPYNFRYIQDHKSTLLGRDLTDDQFSKLIIEESDEHIECDGYFHKSDEFEECIYNNNDECILIAKKHGKGTIILTSIHEFPSPNFLKWIKDTSSKVKL
ncbi:hypothetical protein [Methanosalsum natronophilum]|uniref:Uncharacterized protein n=1 Tax=Methanosalsum natronophilum TaxID=768733 RepID=A0A3R7VSI3_9EURY|nr:hypothetical protein [Methanosalsum natronophilum]RQD83151.1 MAG: hypothetical protein D5R95_06430 [Methanosalsum natronophilum]